MTVAAEPSTEAGIRLVTEIPGPQSRALAARRQAAVAQGPFHVTPIYAASAEGSLIGDVDGNRFLDFTSGIGVTNAGHGLPEAVAAIHTQADRALHTSFNVVPYEGYVAVCERLNELAPGSFAKKSILFNSGAEAVENAIKFARAFTKRQAIICFQHAYHGRTYMAMSLTAKNVPYRAGFGPFNPEVYRVPYPYFYRSTGAYLKACPPTPCSSNQTCLCRDNLAQVKDVILNEVGVENVAAVIFEPVAGEGGFLPMPATFAQSLQSFCREKGILVIADEIQTGFGRTGTVFASEQLGIDPDLLVTAKGMAGGMPVSGVTGRAEVLEATPIGGAGGTYSGNPVACASALATMEFIARPETLAHARTLGETLAIRLESWMKTYPFIGDVRGLGPMRAMEIVKDRSSAEPDKAAVGRLVKHCYEHGLIVMPAGTYGNVIRFLFPLTTSQNQLETGLSIIETGLAELNKTGA